MTRTAIRHTLSALAALALISAFASTLVSAAERELVDALQTQFRGPTSGLHDKPTFGEKFKMGPTAQKRSRPRGLTGKKRPHAPADIDATDFYYSNEGAW
jgi:hypothetical protein